LGFFSRYAKGNMEIAEHGPIAVNVVRVIVSLAAGVMEERY
jgi:hypothetical protein